MAISRQARIITLLVIDSVFFLVVSRFTKSSAVMTNLFQELITGYAVGSLALVADSFHMLKFVIPGTGH